MSVSVLCPTFGRPGFHARLYAGFAAQIHGDKELLVLDDSPQPSPFFGNLRDDRVRYTHVGRRMSVGDKRNWLATEARGEILAHFDDDDYYAPTYLTAMLQNLGDADLVKLSAFYAYSLTHQVFAYWDLAAVAPCHFRLKTGKPPEPLLMHVLDADRQAAWMAKNLMGYGFSCVYRKTAHQKTPFPGVNHAEDFQFVAAVDRAGGNVVMVPDASGIALVVRHAGDHHSVICPQFLLPSHLLPQILGQGAADFLAAASIEAP